MSMQRIVAPVCALALFAGAVLCAPQALTLTFTEAVEPAFSGLTLTRNDNQQVPTGPVKTDPANAAQIIVPFTQPLTAGEYQVAWHVVSVDGHKTQGSYTFSVK